MVSSNASDELVQLRAELAIVREQALVAEAEAAKVWAINADLRARNAHLELMNEQMRRDYSVLGLTQHNALSRAH